MRAFLVVAIGIVAAAHARAEPVRFGTALGLREVWLEGTEARRPTHGVAAVGVVEVPIGAHVSVLVEPGVWRIGSNRYALWELGAGLAIAARQQVARRAEVRVLLGFHAGRILDATYLDRPVTLVSWNREVICGIGVVRTDRRASYFADIRFSRGLSSINSEAPGFWVITEDVGVWVGILL